MNSVIILCPQRVYGFFSFPVAQAVKKKKKKICLQCRRPRFDPWVWKIPWRREWQPVFLPGEPHEQRSLVGYIPQDREESDTTEKLTLH